MSLADKHTVSVQSIPLGRVDPKEIEEQQKKLGDSQYINTKVNQWDCRLYVSEQGKIELVGEKSLGRNGTIKVIVQSQEYTSPLIKSIPYPYDAYTHQGKYIEVNDRRQTTNPEFTKEDKDEYQRQYLASSIVTPQEFFEQAVPSFGELLKQKTLDEYVPRITDELSKINRPHYQAEK
jgi:hypothetical protein